MKHSSLTTAGLMLLGVMVASAYFLFPHPVYYIVTLVSVSILAASFFSPLIGLYLLILTNIIQQTYIFVYLKMNFYEMRLFPYLIFAFVPMLGLWLIKLYRPQVAYDTRTPLNGLLLTVVVFELLAMFWTPTVFFGTYVSIMILGNICIFYLFTGVVTNEEILKKVIAVWIIAGVIQAIGVIIDVWYYDEKSYYFTTKIGLRLAFAQLYKRPGGFAGPSHAAGFISTAVAILFANMLYVKRTILKLIFFILIVVMVAACVLTQTRGVLGALLIGLVFYLSIYPYFKSKIIKYSLLGIMLIFIVLFSVQPKYINRILIGMGYSGSTFFTESNTSYEVQGSATGTSAPEGQSGMRIRIWWWKNGLKAMVAHPFSFLFGLGPGGFVYYSVGSPEVNNIFFAFFYDLGLIGVVLLILIMYILISNIRYYLKNSEHSYTYYMFLGVVAALLMDGGIHALVDFDLNSYGSKNVWIPLSLTMAMINILREEKKNGEMARNQISPV
jgi:hypothetical protein